MNHTKPRINRFFGSTILAVTLTLSSLPFVYSAPGEVNSVNVGRNVQSGVYYNTRGSRTTFKNSGPDGLWVRRGDLVRGLESDSSGYPTGHGGTLYFRAPGSVVRIDGTIDVSALKNGGYYYGNGGKVFVDSTYLYQSGNIFANGDNGGLVQFNVGAATFAPGSQITAMGVNGLGGQIKINASGSVDIQRGAVMDTSGKVVGTYDTNVINIEGGVVNNEGILRANAIAGIDPKGDDNDIVEVEGLTAFRDDDYEFPSDSAGTIRLIASGQSAEECPNCAIQNVDNPLFVTESEEPTFTAEEKAEIIARNNELVSSHDGDVVNSGEIQANGDSDSEYSEDEYGDGYYGYNLDTQDHDNDDDYGYGYDGISGGTIIMGAASDIFNSGLVQANGNTSYYYYYGNGGDGGTVALTALNGIYNTGTIEANGGFASGYAPSTRYGDYSVNGGLLGFGYQFFLNSGLIQAIGGSSLYGEGGRGGLIVFSGPGNPTGGGSVLADGGANYGYWGTVVTPDPESFTSSQNYSSKIGGLGSDNEIDFTRDNELLLNRQNLILLTREGSEEDIIPNVSSEYLSDRLFNAFSRSLDDHTSGDAAEYLTPEETQNFVAYGGSSSDLTLDNPFFEDYDNPYLSALNTMTVLNNGHIYNYDYWHPGAQYRFDELPFIHYTNGGGHLSWIANGSIYNEGSIYAFGQNSGGSVHLAASNGDISNCGFISTFPTLTESSESFFDIFRYEEDFNLFNNHGGSIILKASNDIYNDGAIFGSQSEGEDLQIGATIQLFAGHDIYNNGSIMANAYSYLDLLLAGEYSWFGVDVDGGIIISKAGHNNINTGLITANGEALAYTYEENDEDSDEDDFVDEGEWENYNHEDEDSPSLELSDASAGNGGYIHLHGGNVVLNRATSEEERDIEPQTEESEEIERGVIEANGSSQGGTVILTASGNSDGGLGEGMAPGFSFKNTTAPPATSYSHGINTNLGESVFNFGSIMANDLSTDGNDGSIMLVANRQVGLGSQSSLFDIYLGDFGSGINSFFSSAQSNGGDLLIAAGPHMVERLFCGYQDPSSTTQPGSAPGFDVDFFGLFQHLRPFVDLNLPTNNLIGVLGYEQPTMFFAQEYTEVTLSILNMALAVYKNGISGGAAEDSAMADAIQFLKDAGVDAEVAQQLIQKIQDGSIAVDTKVVDFLSRIANAGSVASAS